MVDNDKQLTRVKNQLEDICESLADLKTFFGTRFWFDGDGNHYAAAKRAIVDIEEGIINLQNWGWDVLHVLHDINSIYDVDDLIEVGEQLLNDDDLEEDD